MRQKQLQAIDRDLHPKAEELAREYIDNFAVSLILQSKIIAYDQKADIVLSNHVREARQMMTRQKRSNRLRDLLIIVGSGIFGALIPALINDLLQVPQALFVLSVAVGVLGIVLVFLGLRR